MRVYLYSFSRCWLPNMPTSAKFRENFNVQQFKVIQGRRFWYQSKAHNYASSLLCPRTPLGALPQDARDPRSLRPIPPLANPGSAPGPVYTHQRPQAWARESTRKRQNELTLQFLDRYSRHTDVCHGKLIPFHKTQFDFKSESSADV